MIVGAVKWNDRKTYYVQANDFLETILGKLGYAQPWQSCGPNAACSCLEALGWELFTLTRGGYSVPADDLLTEWLNNPRNYKMLGPGPDPVREPNNRHARYYPSATRALWNIGSRWLAPFSWRDLDGHLARHRAVMVCINPPGHYISVVAMDQATGEYIANDPWPGRKRVPPMNGDGFNIRLTDAERDSIVSEAVLFYPPGDQE